MENIIFWSKFFPRTVLLFSDVFAFTDVLRVFFRPYRRDYTWVGYMMGIIFRTFWLLGTGVFLILLVVVLFAGFIIYLLLPLFLALLLVERTYPLWGVTGLAFLFLVFHTYSVKTPKLQLDQAGSLEKLKMASIPQLRAFYGQIQGKKYAPFLFWKSIASQSQMKQYFIRLGLNSWELLSQITDVTERIEGDVEDWQSLFLKAKDVGLLLNRRHLSCELLFLAWVQMEAKIEKAFEKLDLEIEQLRAASQWMYSWELRKQSWRYWEDRFFRRRSGVDIGWVAGWMRHLKHFSVNVTDLVKQGKVPYLIGREKLIERITGILQQTTRNNVLLVGSPGVGKTTIAYGIAEKILMGEATGKLARKKVIKLDLIGLLAGTTARGGLEERIWEAMKEIRGGESILFIDEIHSLVGAGGEKGATDIASFIAPVLSAGDIQLIASTTPEDYRRYIEGNPTFASYFQVVKVEEPSAEECVAILEWFVPQMEADQGVRITLPAITNAVVLTQKFIHDRYLPGKAVEILDETSVAVQRKGSKEVRAEDVAAVLAVKTGIPLEQLTINEQAILLNLEDVLHQRIIGQEEAVRVVSNALRRARSGLSPTNRPIASFLFVGPTGVGKTETAKALSQAYFGSEENMIRVDMSEYSNPGQIYRLIGAPPGQVGYEEGGHLTEAVRSRPFAVVLLDEIEKAHTDVHNLLLQVLEDGRLTDGKGRTVSFTNTMIICTSNAFSVIIQESLKKGVSIETIQELLTDNLQKIFRPELLNRFDGVIVFKTLTSEQVEEIAVLMLNGVSERMVEKKIELKFDREVVKRVAELGFDPQFGARPLRRVIQERVENGLAKMLLEGKIEKGESYTFTLEDLPS